MRILQWKICRCEKSSQSQKVTRVDPEPYGSVHKNGSIVSLQSMKTSNDPRHVERIKRMEELFSYSFGNVTETASITGLLDKRTQIDTVIQASAPEWPIDKIAKIDLCILRLAVYELTFDKKAPYKVVIDEAVELAKAYGNEHSAKFINGVLGSVIKDEEAK